MNYKIKQSFLKEINSEYSLKGLILKLHSFGHLMQRADSLEDSPMLGKIERAGGEGSDRWLDGIINSMDMGLNKLWEIVKDRKAWHAVAREITKSQTRFSD